MQLDRDNCTAHFKTKQTWGNQSFEITVDFADLIKIKQGLPVYEGEIEIKGLRNCMGEQTHISGDVQCKIFGNKILNYFDHCREK